MIALNESLPYAAEVAFDLPLSADPLTGLTGYTFSAGEIQVLFPGTSIWVDANLANVVEKGYGRFCLRLTSAQTAIAGDVFLKVAVTGTQNYFGGDVIGTLGGDIGIGGSGSISFFLPDENDPFNNPPLTGHTFASGEVRVCLPDSTYQNVNPSQITELGFGGYKVVLTSAQTTKRGKAFVYAKVTGYQRFEGYVTILDASTPAFTGTVLTPIPVPNPDFVPTSTLRDLITGAVDRLCEYSKSGNFSNVFVDNVGV